MDYGGGFIAVITLRNGPVSTDEVSFVTIAMLIQSFKHFMVKVGALWRCKYFYYV